jgi:hypothetical protein
VLGLIGGKRQMQQIRLEAGQRFAQPGQGTIDDACLPVDQRAIAIEGQRFLTGEVDLHVRS